MRSPILNREFAFDPAGWIEVLRVGEYPHSSGIIQVVDGAALDSIVANFNRLKQQSNFPGLLIDFDHFSSDLSKPSEAAGWIVELKREGDWLLARVDWSAAGEAALKSGNYRLLSPVFDRADMADLGNNRMRPLRLDSAGLTNAPNMKNLMPISNRAACTVTDSEAATLSPRAAGEQISIIANRVKTEKGWTFDQAWNHVRATEPALFNRMCVTPQPRTAQAPDTKVINRQQRDSRCAADRLRELATNRQQKRSIPFDSAWQEVCRTFPDLNAKAHGCAYNRANTENESLSPAELKTANDFADEAFSFFDDEAKRMRDRGNFMTDADDDRLSGMFHRAIDWLTAYGMTRRQAFDDIQKTEPIFWARCILSLKRQMA